MTKTLNMPKRNARNARGTVFALTLGKGGVGKTSSTNALSFAFAEQGKRVLAIDLDPQGGLTRSWQFVPRDFQQTIYHVLLRQVSLQEVLIQPPETNIHLAPANLNLSATDVELQHDKSQTLRQILAPVLTHYDVVLLDCPSNLGKMTMNALVAADCVLIPFQCHFLALDSLEDIFLLIEEVREKSNPTLEYFIFRTFFKRTLHVYEMSDDILSNHKERVLTSKIRDTVKIPDSALAGKSILQFQPNSLEASAYRQIAFDLAKYFHM